jgi:hypothetical protein
MRINLHLKLSYLIVACFIILALLIGYLVGRSTTNSAWQDWEHVYCGGAFIPFNQLTRPGNYATCRVDTTP